VGRLGAVHNGILCIFSLAMWVAVVAGLVLESPWSSPAEFFCLPDGEPVMPPKFALLPYLFYVSKIYEVECITAS
jgi:hypothetical protein